MSDQVFLSGLEVKTLIGVYDFERISMQTLTLDLTLGFDCSKAGQSDALPDALDYDRLAKRIRGWAAEQRFLLLEAFAEQLCQVVLSEFDVTSIDLTVNKPGAVMNCARMGVRIQRQREAQS